MSAAFAIAAGVVGVGAAVTGGIVQSQAAGRAAKAQGKASKNLQKRTNQAANRFIQNQQNLQQQIREINPNIQIPQYDIRGATLDAIEQANRVTENTLRNIEKFTGEAPEVAARRALQEAQGWQQRIVEQYQRIEGTFPIMQRAEAGVSAAEATLGRAEAGLGRAEAGIGAAEMALGRAEPVLTEAERRLARAEGRLGRAEATLAGQLPQIQRAREIVDTYLTGDIPEATKRQLTRAIAETAGAGFNPATAGMVGGFQVGQANLAENLRQTAEERQRFGLGMVPGITQQAASISAGQAGIAGQLGQLGLGTGQLAGQRAEMASRLGQLAGQRAGIAGQLGQLGMGMGQLAGQRADIARGMGQLAAIGAGLGQEARGWQGLTQEWFKLGGAFQQEAVPFMQLGLQGRGQDINVAQANIANRIRQLQEIGGINTEIYNAMTGAAQTGYAAQTETAKAALARDMAGAQMIQDIGGATSGALAGIGSARRYAGIGGGSFPGGFDYTKAYGPATYGTPTTGWGKFDYGSGTGA